MELVAAGFVGLAAFDVATGVEVATITGAFDTEEATSGVGDATGVEETTAAEEDAGEASTEAATLPEDPKFEPAVVLAPAEIATFFTTTVSPLELVTRTSTVVVPNPAEFSKKLYVCLVVDFHVLPPSVETSKLFTALLALTTCMLNQ